MGSGMGIPSMGIYSYELYHFYDVDNIIRIGSAGGNRRRGSASGCCFCHEFLHRLQLWRPISAAGYFCPHGRLFAVGKRGTGCPKARVSHHVGSVVTSDLFYGDYEDSLKDWKKMGVLAVEMESAGLYMNAARAGKKALALFTVSDLPLTGEGLSAKERQTTFTQMMEIALEIAE